MQGLAGQANLGVIDPEHRHYPHVLAVRPAWNSKVSLRRTERIESTIGYGDCRHSRYNCGSKQQLERLLFFPKLDWTWAASLGFLS